MAEFMWSDFLLALIAVVLAVLLATGYPGERKVKPKKLNVIIRKSGGSYEQL